MRRFWLPIACFVFLVVQVPTLLACSCGATRTPAEEFAGAHVVFRGTVTEKVDRQSVFRNAWNTFLTLIGREGDFTLESDAKKGGFKVEFSVDKMWRGLASREIAIFTGRGGGDCGVPFEVGKDYLVYGWCNDEAECFSFICSRTRPLRNAAEDLRYLSSRTALPLPPE